MTRRGFDVRIYILVKMRVKKVKQMNEYKWKEAITAHCTKFFSSCQIKPTFRFGDNMVTVEPAEAPVGRLVQGLHTLEDREVADCTEVVFGTDAVTDSSTMKTYRFLFKPPTPKLRARSPRRVDGQIEKLATMVGQILSTHPASEIGASASAVGVPVQMQEEHPRRRSWLRTCVFGILLCVCAGLVIVLSTLLARLVWMM